jgi:hypothetical protein
MKLVAKNELIDAIHYYDNQREGLGLEFSNQVKITILAIMHIKRNPKRW